MAVRAVHVTFVGPSWMVAPKSKDVLFLKARLIQRLKVASESSSLK